MTIEGVMIIMVGSSATLFLLSGAWWLWRRAPMPAPPHRPARSGPPLGPPPDAPQWMAWSEPGAPPVPPSAEQTLFEQSTLEPINELIGQHTGEIDKARTMFFFKKPPDKTQILPEGAEIELMEADEDAPLRRTDQAQTAPLRKTKAKRRQPPPPPPRRN